MSAFMVSTTHIRAIVTAARFDTYDQLPVPDWLALFQRFPEAFARCVATNEHGVPVIHAHASGRGWRNWCEDELGRALVVANVDSLRARYPGSWQKLTGGTADELVNEHRHAFHELPAVSAIKQVHCFDYQACEVSGYADTWAARFCDQLVRVLIPELPGYEAAPWGVDDPEDGAPEPGTAGAPVSLMSLIGKGAR